MNDQERKAMEMALEALEWIANVNAMDYEYQRKANEPIEALRQALAQPKQEPELVAVIGNWGRVEWVDGVYPQIGDRMYSAPPSKPWVSLSDDEAYQLLVDYCDDDLGLLNAIEAALKEKNNG